MKKFLLLPFFCFPFFAFAQNLVPNPSFEEYTECPNVTGALENSLYWLVFRNTPDYMNSCTSNPIVDVPNNYFGYHEASTGKAYAGLYTMGFKDYREIIGIGLSEPLEIGQKYYVSYKAVLSNYENGICTCYSNNLGAKFTTIPYNSSNPIPIDNSSHINRTDLLSDSINWTTVKGSFIPDSAYRYCAIGNFFDNLNTDTIQIAPPGQVAYYLIDDVCVSKDSIDCEFPISIESNYKQPLYFYYNDGGVYYRGASLFFTFLSITKSDGSLIFKEQNLFIENGQRLCNINEGILINVLYSTKKIDFKNQKLLTIKF